MCSDRSCCDGGALLLGECRHALSLKRGGMLWTIKGQVGQVAVDVWYKRFVMVIFPDVAPPSASTKARREAPRAQTCTLKFALRASTASGGIAVELAGWVRCNIGDAGQQCLKTIANANRAQKHGDYYDIGMVNENTYCKS
ncbi:hypothetical protein NDU88_003950 [Pleurodeles waltl]|uniref:Uncharacterized protein n=1 Tax=Pleurodeles waltl TaxID=8319 RepID=A0AAV7L794_PLEWA|nr:hypothetical protein NDU88_003950 [Pleurodeles waltl]